MLDIGIQELLIIMVLALLVFGPEKLPELGRRLGRAMREFRRASDEFRSTIETNLRLNEDLLLPSSANTPGPAAAETPVGAPTGDDAGGAGAEGAHATSDATLAGAPAHAGDGTGSAAEGARSAAEPLEPFWTQRGGRLLHRSACSWRARAPEADRIALKAATDGWDLGLLPCPACDPRGAEVTS